MRTPVLSACFLLGSLVSATALADACHVTTRSATSAVPEVAEELCYEFVGVSEGTIDWSCGSDSDQVLSTQTLKVERCPGDSLGRCEAALTQATLANYRAGGEDRSKARPALPNDAKVITRYYRAEELKQVRIDCENLGGTWRDGE